MAVVLRKGALVLAEHRFPATPQPPQLLHRSSRWRSFSSFHRDPWAFAVQILDTDLHGTSLWALGLQLDLGRTLSWAPGPLLDSLGLSAVDRFPALFYIWLFGRIFYNNLINYVSCIKSFPC